MTFVSVNNEECGSSWVSPQIVDSAQSGSDCGMWMTNMDWAEFVDEAIGCSAAAGDEDGSTIPKNIPG